MSTEAALTRAVAKRTHVEIVFCSFFFEDFEKEEQMISRDIRDLITPFLSSIGRRALLLGWALFIILNLISKLAIEKTYCTDDRVEADRRWL